MQTAVKERPILFSGAMIRAILEGRKTQTRRVIKKQPPEHVTDIVERGKYWQWHYNNNPDPNSEFPDGLLEIVNLKSPYGNIGDRLWCKETWAEHPDGVENEGWVYRATDPGWDDEETGLKWKPSTQIPRSASRITLEITGVRVERLQDISEEDAKAEGVRRIGDNFPNCKTSFSDGPNFYSIEYPDWSFNAPTAKECFAHLWDSVNTDRGYSWDSNPFVWVVEFKRIEG